MTARREATAERILDAAEHLLAAAGDPAGFGMRELAGRAGVSFATPFNRFGGKGGVFAALSARLIDAMAQRLAAAPPAGDAIDAALHATAIATAVLLERLPVSRAVVAAVGGPGEAGGGGLPLRSAALWSAAIGEAAGFDPALREAARALLPGQLATGFRGVLSFWVAGDVADPALPAAARRAATVALAAFAAPDRRNGLLAGLASGAS